MGGYVIAHCCPSYWHCIHGELECIHSLEFPLQTSFLFTMDRTGSMFVCLVRQLWREREREHGGRGMRHSYMPCNTTLVVPM